MNLIVLSIDGLGARYLGPYGNTWIDTPAVNRFSATGTLFEQAFAGGESVIASWNSVVARSNSDHSTFLVHDRSDWHEALSESSEVSRSFQFLDSFDQFSYVELNCDARADDWSETHVARIFASLLFQLEEFASSDAEFIGWCDTQSLFACWDAPSELAELHRGEDDPEPYAELRPPQGLFASDETDPDTLLAFSHAYAAQIVVLDRCIESLITRLEQLGLEQTTAIALTAGSAFPLGQHSVVGKTSGSVFGESSHVPLVISHPALANEARRILPPIQHVDLCAFLTDLLQGEVNSTSLIEKRNQFPFAFCKDGASKALITPAWMLVVCGGQQMLFAKPDDQWEVNDVKDRCPEIAQSMLELIGKLEEQGDSGQLPEFDKALITGR